MSRQYYDPNNPVMLSIDEISRLTPQECLAATNQIDQNLVQVLLDIDHSLIRANTIINHDILPNVQQYGEHSQQIWNSVKFWKSFFEASANVKLSDPYYTEEASTSSESSLKQDNNSQQDASLSFSDQPDQHNNNNNASPAGPTDEGQDEGGETPRPPQRTTSTHQHQLDPFAALQADLNHLRLASSPVAAPHPGASKKQQSAGLPLLNPDISLQSTSSSTSLLGKARDQARLVRKEHHFDEVSQLGSELGGVGESPSPSFLHAAGGGGKGKERADDDSMTIRIGTEEDDLMLPLPLPEFETLHNFERFVSSSSAAAPLPVSPLPRGARAGSSHHHPLLLEKVLRKNQNQQNGAGAIVDPSPAKPAKKLVLPPSIPQGWSGLADLGQLTQTPAKEAARRMARDVYDHFAPQEERQEKGGVDSPLPSPPSAVKHYQRLSMMPRGSPSPSPGGQAGDGQEDEEEEEGVGIGNAMDQFEFGAETARIEDLLSGGRGEFDGIVDDDGHHHLGVEGEEELTDGLSGEGGGLVGGESFTEAQHDEYDDEEGEGDVSRIVGSGPEDTLFGIGRNNTSRAPQSFRHDDTFDSPGVGGGKSGFRVMGNVEETLHGGILLESEPFEASPLAGRQGQGQGR
ncbi:hypothetical protein T439DRAFT_51922 [Meredithblackwellia eburnea MCA 4105]